MRDGKWELQVLCDDELLPEHTIEGRACVEARPGCKFAVRVKYEGTELHQIECFVDEKSVTGRQGIDGAHCTTYPNTESTFKQWRKSQDGQAIKSDLIFEESRTADGGNEDAGSGLASGPADWTRGAICVRVHGGVKHTLDRDAYAASNNPDMSRASALSERAMVKGGHSASAGEDILPTSPCTLPCLDLIGAGTIGSAGVGSKQFAQEYKWRAGQSFVAPAPGDPLQLELKVYYRDAFFLLLRGDESKVKDVPTAESDAGYSNGVVKARNAARKVVETGKALAKRPKVASAVIDLTDD